MSVLKLSDLLTDIREILKRGTLYDSSIPRWVRKALLELERDHTFEWMRHTETITIAADGYAFTLTEPPVKRIDYVRTTLDDGSFKYYPRINPEQVDYYSAAPCGYWMTSESAGRFDAVLDEETDFEFSYFRLVASDLDIDNPATAEHPLFDLAEDVVVSLAVMKAAVIDVADEAMAFVTSNYEREISSLANYADAMERAGRTGRPNYARVRRRRSS